MKENLLILEDNGMIGHFLLKHFNYFSELNIYDLLRDKKLLKDKFLYHNENIKEIEFEQIENIYDKLSQWQINIVINYLGTVKQAR